MRLLVTGGRHYGMEARLHRRHSYDWVNAAKQDSQETTALYAALDALPRPSVIIHGGASGADTLADRWAKRNGIPVEVYKANWYPDGFGRLDKSAGPRRNQEMIDRGKPDLVIACEGGAGTADMVRRARAAGVEVREVGR